MPSNLPLPPSKGRQTVLERFWDLVPSEYREHSALAFSRLKNLNPDDEIFHLADALALITLILHTLVEGLKAVARSKETQDQIAVTVQRAVDGALDRRREGMPAELQDFRRHLDGIISAATVKISDATDTAVSDIRQATEQPRPWGHEIIIALLASVMIWNWWFDPLTNMGVRIEKGYSNGHSTCTITGQSGRQLHLSREDESSVRIISAQFYTDTPQ